MESTISVYSQTITDQELVAGVLNRDKEAIQRMVSKYHRQVIRTAFHFVQDADDAEDIAQDVCLEILESVGSFRGASTLSTWIYRLTVNKSLNFIRKNKRKQLVRKFETFFRKEDTGVHSDIVEPSTNKNQLDEDETKLLLEKAVNSLPENQRIAFVLNKYDELTYKEIAGVMNTSLASVESLLQRAKQNLQKKLIVHFHEYAPKK